MEFSGGTGMDLSPRIGPAHASSSRAGYLVWVLSHRPFKTLSPAHADRVAG
jgi:hypothetical protein